MSTHMVLLVIYDPEKLNDLLAAWEEAGVSGATVFFTTGMGRIRMNEGLRDDLPLLPSLEDFYPNLDHIGRTVFSVVDDEALLQRVISATTEVLGDLNTPRTGLLLVLPVSQVLGLIKSDRS